MRVRGREVMEKGVRGREVMEKGGEGKGEDEGGYCTRGRACE